MRTNPNGSLTDLYETPDETTEELHRTMFADVVNPGLMTIYDPCCGHDAILKVFERHGFKVIGDDLHTKPDKKDFITNPDLPPYDIIVTNPPFSCSTKILFRLYEEGKPFCVLLPVANLVRKAKMEYFFEFGITVHALNTVPRFKHEGKDVQVQETAWFVWDGIVRDGSDHSRVEVKRCFLPTV